MGISVSIELDSASYISYEVVLEHALVRGQPGLFRVTCTERRGQDILLLEVMQDTTKQRLGERIMGQGVGVDVPAAKKAMVRDLLWRSFLGTLSDKVNLCRLSDVLVPLVKVLSENIREETRCLASDFEEQVASILMGRSAS